MSKHHEVYIRLDIPCAAFHDDIGYHYVKSRSAYERITPDDAIHTLDPNTVRNCLSSSPSNYMFGPGIDLARYSFPIGPPLEYASGANVPSQFHRSISDGTTMQLYCVFVNKRGNAVPGWVFDARKQKYVVFTCHYMSQDKGILSTFDEFLEMIGLSSWSYKTNTPSHVVSKSKPRVSNMMCQGCLHTKMALSSPTVTSVPSICYSSGDRVLPVLGQSMCMSEDGSMYFGVLPHVVPSAAHELYPMIYASVNEPGLTSSKGPCELFLVHFQFPSEAPVVLMNPDIILDKEVSVRLEKLAASSDSSYATDAYNFSTGVFNGVLGNTRTGESRICNPLILVRDQKIRVSGDDFWLSIQGLNIALVDAPVVYRVLQLYVVRVCGVDATRLSFLDPEDTGAMLAHKVNDWLEAHGVLPGPSLHQVCNAMTEAIVKAFDDHILFNALMSHIEQLNPKKVDKSGLFHVIKETLSKELCSISLSLVVKIALQKDIVLTSTEHDNDMNLEMEVPLLIYFHE